MFPIQQQRGKEGAQLRRECCHERQGEEYGRDRPAEAHIMIAVGTARHDRHDLAGCLCLCFLDGSGDKVVVGLIEKDLHHQSPEAPPPPKLPPPEKPPPPLPQLDPPPPPEPHPEPMPGPQMMTGAPPSRR